MGVHGDKSRGARRSGSRPKYPLLQNRETVGVSSSPRSFPRGDTFASWTRSNCNSDDRTTSPPSTPIHTGSITGDKRRALCSHSSSRTRARSHSQDQRTPSWVVTLCIAVGTMLNVAPGAVADTTRVLLIFWFVLYFNGECVWKCDGEGRVAW